MSLDAGLLWGEAFITRYPSAKWSIGRRPKLSIDYQQPVIIGEDIYHSEFNPIREMIAFVDERLSGRKNKNSLNVISLYRAWLIGLDVHPDGLEPFRGPSSISDDK
jgi:hypothetical protein